MRIVALVILATLVPPAARAAAPSLDRAPDYLDRQLAQPYTAETPLRSTGACLWATHPAGFGFPSDVHYVHLDWLEAFRLDLAWNGATVAAGAARAYPSHLDTDAVATAGLELRESKFITAADVLVSAIRVRNTGVAPGSLRVSAAGSLLGASGTGALGGTRTLHGIPVDLRLELSGGAVAGAELVREVTLAPGEAVEVRAAMAFARSPADAALRVAAVLAAGDAVADQVAAFGRWFLDQVPGLDVPDPWFQKAWDFRWTIVRRTMTEPGVAPLRYPTVQEGRWSAPWFDQTITYGAPHQLREMRWLRDPRYARGHALTLVENLRADGAFVGVALDGFASEYTDWIGAAIGQTYLVSGDTDLLLRAAPAMRRNVAYQLGRDGDGDGLPAVGDHYQTGMEWQPAFFHFNGYRTDRSTPLERVDYAAALHANASAAASALDGLCEPAAAAAERATAERTRAAIEARMWDEGEGLYFDLRESDDARALAREIVGFYPFAFGIAPPEHDRAMAALFDPTDFWTPWPPASSSLRCPATDQDGWPIGPGGSQAMWNGPTWPHATSVVAEAVGRTLRRSGETIVSRAQLFALLESYTRAHFRSVRTVTDFEVPWVGEYYHGVLGVWKTGEIDYFHSTYADLLLTLLIGIVPADDAVVRLDPLLPAGRWDRFLVERLRYRGHDLTIVWDGPGGGDEYGDGREGFDLYVDDALAASRPDLGPLSAELEEPVLHAVKETGAGTPRFTLAGAGADPWSLFRSPAPDLAGAAPLPGSPFTGPDARDAAPPPSAFYRVGACGRGR